MPLLTGIDTAAGTVSTGHTLSGHFQFHAKVRPDMAEARIECGFHHIGVKVDSLERSKALFRRHRPRGVMVPELGPPYHGELRFHDTEVAPVSVSSRGFVDPQTSGQRLLQEIVLDVLDPEQLVDFYREVFGFEQLDESPGLRGYMMTDGDTRLRVRPFYGTRDDEKRRYGISRVVLQGGGASGCDPDGNCLRGL